MLTGDRRDRGTIVAVGDGDSELLCEPGPFSFGADKTRVLLDGELWDKAEEIGFPYMDCPC